VAETVKPMADELLNARCDRYVAADAKDLATYGLDKPYLRAVLVAEEKDKTVAPTDKTKDKSTKPSTKEHELMIGKPADKTGKARYAKRAGHDAVFVVGEKLVTALDHRALDLLDRDLLKADSGRIDAIRIQNGTSKLTLQRKGDQWQVLDSP